MRALVQSLRPMPSWLHAPTQYQQRVYSRSAVSASRNAVLAGPRVAIRVPLALEAKLALEVELTDVER